MDSTKLQTLRDVENKLIDLETTLKAFYEVADFPDADRPRWPSWLVTVDRHASALRESFDTHYSACSVSTNLTAQPEA